MPTLGLQTTGIAAKTDAAIVERTWGLLQTTAAAADPRRGRKEREQQQQQRQSYGPNFSYREYARPRSRLHGILMHYGLSLLLLVMFTPPLRALARRFFHQPGDGPGVELARADKVEFRGVAEPDVPGALTERAFSRCWYNGPMYYCKSEKKKPLLGSFSARELWADRLTLLLFFATVSGLMLAQAASTILQEDLGLEGGIYTPACLGQAYIDSLDSAGFRFETKMVPA